MPLGPRWNTTQQILDYLETQKGTPKSVARIAATVGCGHATVKRHIAQLANEGTVRAVGKKGPRNVIRCYELAPEAGQDIEVYYDRVWQPVRVLERTARHLTISGAAVSRYAPKTIIYRINTTLWRWPEKRKGREQE